MSILNERPASGETSTLQFDHAEAGVAPVDDTPASDEPAPETRLAECVGCGSELSQAYYAVGDGAMCGPCKEEVVAVIEARTQPKQFFRAVGYGVPAAMLGSAIYYAIVALTGYEIGLVAILIGFMVGAAVRAASGPGGGRRYQLLAAGLTYCAIVTTYVPFVIEGFVEAAAAEEEAELPAEVDPLANESTADVTAAPPAEVTAPADEDPASALAVLLAFALVFAIAFVAPFLAGFENIMGILIIGFGVYQAWKMNKRVDLEITGPHALGPQPAEST